jgi:hypothetical protein
MTMSVTKTIQIERPAAETFAFVADPETMPQWAIHNIKAIRKLDNLRWEMETPRGKATLIPHYEEGNGILDHQFIDAGKGVWNVAGRIVPVDWGSTRRLVPKNWTLSIKTEWPCDPFGESEHSDVLPASGRVRFPVLLCKSRAPHRCLDRDQTIDIHPDRSRQHYSAPRLAHPRSTAQCLNLSGL